MDVAVMAVFAVFLGLRVVRRPVVVVRVAVMVVADVVGMESRGRTVLSRMPMNADGRCPGELERHDEHDDQGDKAAHEMGFYRFRCVHQGSDRTRSRRELGSAKASRGRPARQ